MSAIAIIGGDERNKAFKWPVGYTIRCYCSPRNKAGDFPALLAACRAGGIDLVIALTNWNSHNVTKQLKNVHCPVELWPHGASALMKQLPAIASKHGIQPTDVQSNGTKSWSDEEVEALRLAAGTGGTVFTDFQALGHHRTFDEVLLKCEELGLTFTAAPPPTSTTSTPAPSPANVVATESVDLSVKPVALRYKMLQAIDAVPRTAQEIGVRCGITDKVQLANMIAAWCRKGIVRRVEHREGLNRSRYCLVNSQITAPPPTPPTSPRERVFGVLKDAEKALTIKEIADYLGMSSPQVSGVLRRAPDDVVKTLRGRGRSEQYAYALSNKAFLQPAVEEFPVPSPVARSMAGAPAATPAAVKEKIITYAVICGKTAEVFLDVDTALAHLDKLRLTNKVAVLYRSVATRSVIVE